MFFAHGSNPSSSEEKISSASAHPGTNDRRTTATRMHHLNRMKKDLFCFNHWLERKEVANKRTVYMCQGLRPNRYHQQQQQQQHQHQYQYQYHQHHHHHHHHHHLCQPGKDTIASKLFYSQFLPTSHGGWVSGVITVVVIHLSRR